MHDQEQIRELEEHWINDSRWDGIERPYSAEDVVRLRGSIQIDYPLARMGAERLWKLMHEEPFVRSLGALTGNQAIQQIQAGLQAIYVSGWQVAADNNHGLTMYPDQSLYPADSAPTLVKRINNALIRTDQIYHMHGENSIHWFAPIVADAESGFGGPLNTFELMKAMIDAGAAAVHFEDQLSSLKKCGHMGGKVLVSARSFNRKLGAARLAADILGIPTILIARTDADSAHLIRSNVDPVDRAFMTGERTMEGYFDVKGGVEYAIARGRAFAPYADVLWCETSTPDLGEAREFAEGIHELYPGKLLAYNCSPSFNWRMHMDEKELGVFQEKLGEMGYKFQFVTLAGFHSLNASMFDLATSYGQSGMLAYSKLQEHELDLEKEAGYRAVKHQSFVGVGYFDEVQMVVTGGESATTALKGSTEESQFATN